MMTHETRALGYRANVNVLPLRTKNEIMFIRIDTTSIIALLWNPVNDGKMAEIGNFEGQHLNIWKKFLNFNAESVNENKFHFQIVTNGVEASVVHKRTRPAPTAAAAAAAAPSAAATTTTTTTTAAAAATTTTTTATTTTKPKRGGGGGAAASVTIPSSRPANSSSSSTTSTTTASASSLQKQLLLSMPVDLPTSSNEPAFYQHRRDPGYIECSSNLSQLRQAEVLIVCDPGKSVPLHLMARKMGKYSQQEGIDFMQQHIGRRGNQQQTHAEATTTTTKKTRGQRNKEDNVLRVTARALSFAKNAPEFRALEHKMKEKTCLVSLNEDQKTILSVLSSNASCHEMSVLAIEQKLQEHSVRRANSVAQLKTNLMVKNYAREATRVFYEMPLWRKNRFSKYIRMQRFYSQLRRVMVEKYGPPEKALVVMGDHAAGPASHIRGLAPVPEKGMVKLLRRFGYPLLFVQEYHTSKKCSKCQNPHPDEGICKKFMVVNDPRPWKRGQRRLCHGLLRCNSCKTLWDRDMNGVLNMTNIALSVRAGCGRVDYLCMVSASSTTTTTAAAAAAAAAASTTTTTTTTATSSSSMATTSTTTTSD
jgi:hypothetical protein